MIYRMMIPHRWTRPEAIDVCLEALATGRVHGISPNHDPDLLAHHSSFTQNGLDRHTMWRDWGLFEAHFVNGRCEFFMVQAHRMKKPPKWKRLRPHLEPYGLAPGTVAAPGAEYHRVVASDSEVCVDSDSGRIVKISVPATPPLTRPDTPLRQHLRRDIRAVATGPRGSWNRWLDKRPSGEWSRYPELLPDLPVDFGLWLLDRAREVWPVDEWAWRWSRFVLARPGTVPVGAVAAVCLAALPLTRAEAAELPRDWRGRTPAEIRRSRMTLALLRTAALDVSSPPVDPELAAWRPLLRGVG